MTGSPPALAHLLDEGYCIVPNLVEPEVVARIAAELDGHFARARPSRGAFSGSDTRRIGCILNRSDQIRTLVTHPGVLALAQGVLGPWCDHISLNLGQAIELAPGSREQVPHRDQDMWPCSRLVDRRHRVEFLLNVMWPLTPFCEANGATRIWPGSHRRQDELLIAPEESVVAAMVPGSALVFLGSTLHAAGANTTSIPRRGVIVSYCLGWLKPYELPWLAYPPAVARHFPKGLADLAGYRVHRPNLGVVDGRCPSRLLHGDRGPVRAEDALLPEQDDLIRAWRDGRITARDFAGASRLDTDGS